MDLAQPAVREALLGLLAAMADPGGFYVIYIATQRKGWGGVDLSIIKASCASHKSGPG